MKETSTELCIEIVWNYLINEIPEVDKFLCDFSNKHMKYNQYPLWSEFAGEARIFWRDVSWVTPNYGVDIGRFFGTRWSLNTMMNGWMNFAIVRCYKDGMIEFPWNFNSTSYNTSKKVREIKDGLIENAMFFYDIEEKKLE